jgi:phage shock protein PspC (stress-responsive transcriptional regulator)
MVRLERPHSGRWVAGVAHGLSARYDVGVGWIRLGFALLAFAGGLGIVLYAAGWLLLPDEGSAESTVTRALGNVDQPTRWVGIGMIALAGAIVVGWSGLVRGELMFAGLLVLAGLLLYRGDLPPRTPPPGRPPDDPAGVGPGLDEARRPDEAIPQDGGAAGHDAAPPAARPEGPPAGSPAPVVESQPRPPRAPRPRSALGLFTVGTALAVVGVLAMATTGGVSQRDVRDLLGAAFLVIGAGLLIGTWLGRSRGLIVLGIVLAPLALMAFVLPLPLRGDVGERTFAVSNPETAPAYEMLAGDMRLDLRSLEPDAAGTVHASLGFGRLLVLLPGDLNPMLETEIGIGEFELSGLGARMEDGGLDVRRSIDLGGDGDLVLDLRVGIGQIDVEEE